LRPGRAPRPLPGTPTRSQTRRRASWLGPRGWPWRQRWPRALPKPAVRYGAGGGHLGARVGCWVWVVGLSPSYGPNDQVDRVVALAATGNNRWLQSPKSVEVTCPVQNITPDSAYGVCRRCRQAGAMLGVAGQVPWHFGFGFAYGQTSLIYRTASDMVISRPLPKKARKKTKGIFF
jgi:hypothetical protein